MNVDQTGNNSSTIVGEFSFPIRKDDVERSASSLFASRLIRAYVRERAGAEVARSFRRGRHFRFWDAG